MLAAVTVLVILLGIIAAVTQGTTVAVHQASGKMSTYAAARAAFNTITAKLGQATLNTYLDYYGTSSGSAVLSVRTAATASTFIPTTYGRVSDLQFIVRQNSDSGLGQEVYFQCPEAYSTTAAYQATQGLLNACGYYVQYDGNVNYRPTLIVFGGVSTKYRYRLMQAIQPTELLQIYATSASSDATSPGPTSDTTTWLKNIANTGSGKGATLAPLALPLADNIIALVIWPRASQELDANIIPAPTPLAPNYTYDSQASVSPTGTPPSQLLTANQLPPIVQVTMVAIDEASATRLSATATPPAAPTIIETALSGKFTNVANYSTDLSALEASLAANHIEFEVLNSTVVMRESKWSQ